MIYTSKDGMRFVIRTARMSDLAEILRYFNGVIEERVPGLPFRNKYTLAEERKWLKGTVDGVRKGNRFYLLAETGGRIVASAGLSYSSEEHALDNRHMMVFGITVAEGYRGKGLGSELIRQMIAWARKKRLDLLELNVYDTNRDARRLYERFGFRKVAEIPFRTKRGNKYISHVVMQLHLR